MSRLFRRPSSSVPSHQPRAPPEHHPDAGQLYDDADPSSAYSSLLNDHDHDHDHDPSPSDLLSDPDAALPAGAQRWRHRRTKSSPAPAAWANPEFTASRPWLSTAEGRPSWAGERPPTRKLVKDPNGSARPSMSIELSDSDGEKDKGIVKRGFERLRGLYRREKGE